MARVVTSFRILPADINTKLSELKENIKKSLPPEAQVYKFEEEPIAFGIVALHAHIVVPEEPDGGLEKLENILTKVNGVGQIDVTMVRRA